MNSPRQLTIDQAIQVAIVHHESGRLSEAENIYRQVLARQPDHPDALHLLGVVAFNVRRLELASELIQRAIALNPSLAVAHSNLGNVFRIQGKLDKAAESYRRAIQLKPDYADAHNNLGIALKEQGRLEESIASYSQAINLKSDFAEAHNNLANALSDLGRLDEAAAAGSRAVELKPHSAKAHSNLGNIFKDQGRLDEALASYRRAMELAPDDYGIHDNLIVALNYHPASDASTLLQENIRWAQKYAEPLRPLIRPHRNAASPDRRLKIGYVSADFKAHACANYLIPLLSHHDHKGFEIICYSDVPWPDDLTRRMQPLADVWRNTVGWSDEQVNEQIRSDGIDILVDLKLHTKGHRLLVFARRPAPIQVSWLGYPGTTGLSTIDYRLTDPFLDPPGAGDECYTEKSIRLPHCFWCYDPIIQTAAVNSLPALESGFVTFGCFNNFCKVTEIARQLWIRVLAAIPRSRMLIQSHSQNLRQTVGRMFQDGGIAPERLEFVGKASIQDYFRLYHRVDVCLDPMPYCGHTTTMDGFWMGVPVVTLAGRTAAACGGVTLLSNVGLTELIAHTPDEYVSIAARLAGDLPALAALRSGLRERMKNSPLMDARGFARDMEAAFGKMWRSWCEGDAAKRDC